MNLYVGLNPVSCAHEQGIEMKNHAMATIMDYLKFLNGNSVKWGKCQVDIYLRRPISSSISGYSTLKAELPERFGGR